jgi:hypothetical protein
MGFFPCDNPQLSVSITITDPLGAEYTGGAVSAPLFKSLGDFAIRHYEIAPGTPDDPAAADPTAGGPVQAVAAAASTEPPGTSSKD